jgi:hypothetical protein
MNFCLSRNTLTPIATKMTPSWMTWVGIFRRLEAARHARIRVRRALIRVSSVLIIEAHVGFGIGYSIPSELEKSINLEVCTGIEHISGFLIEGIRVYTEHHVTHHVTHHVKAPDLHLSCCIVAAKQFRNQQQRTTNECERNKQRRRLPVRKVLYEQLYSHQDENRVGQPACLRPPPVAT